MSAQPAYTVRLADWEDDRAALREVRNDVFIVEQRVPAELEWDDMDARSRHALAEDARGYAIGCARLLPDGHIGRVAVRASWRKRGVGAALVTRLIELARELEHPELILNAQTHALPFYARFGFAVSGAPFEEAGIPHREMRLRLKPRPMPG
ncbi:MAG TPA: GNAT family N-acetyltransferase [Casimicrobiaceae bacterium]|nr:GNAT family N-acetyltransferase [Casimicrobiaceae bacterium]